MGPRLYNKVIIPVIVEAWDDGRHGMAFRGGAGNNGPITAFRFDLQWDGSTNSYNGDHEYDKRVRILICNNSKKSGFLGRGVFDLDGQ
jgi:hypothetical protein